MAMGARIGDNGCRAKRAFSSMCVGVEFSTCPAIGASDYAGFFDFLSREAIVDGFAEIKFLDATGPRAIGLNWFDIAAMVTNQLMITGIKT